MSGWVGGWVSRWVGGWMSGWVSRWVGGWMSGWVGGFTSETRYSNVCKGYFYCFVSTGGDIWKIWEVSQRINVLHGECMYMCVCVCVCVYVREGESMKDVCVRSTNE